MLDAIISTSRTILTSLVSALILLLLGFIFGRLMGRFVVKALQEVETNYHLKKVLGIQFPLDRICGEVVSFIVYIYTVVLVPRQLDIVGPTVYLLLGALSILILLSLLVGLKDFFPNFLARFSLSKELEVGKKFTFRKLKLEVIQIGLLETQTQTKDGDILFFPNAQILKHIREKK